MLEVAKRQPYIDFWSNTIYTFQRTKYEKMTQTENSASQTHGVKEVRVAHEKIKTALHEITTQMEIILTVLEKETKPPPFPDDNQTDTAVIPECLNREPKSNSNVIPECLNRESSLPERRNLADHTSCNDLPLNITEASD